MSTLEKIKLAQELFRTGVSTYTMTSLDAPLATPAGEEAEATLVDVLVSPDPSPELVAATREERTKLALAMRELHLREVATLALRFAGWELETVGAVFQLSRERIRGIEREAGARLRQVLVEAAPAAAPAPAGRPPRRPPPDPRHQRMVELWQRLKSPDLDPGERDRLQREHRALEAELRLLAGEGS